MVEETVVEGRQFKYGVELTKNTRGYNWTIKVNSDNKGEALAEAFELEEKCRERYSKME
jgi:hypothetical protein